MCVSVCVRVQKCNRVSSYNNEFYSVVKGGGGDERVCGIGWHWDYQESIAINREKD